MPNMGQLARVLIIVLAVWLIISAVKRMLRPRRRAPTPLMDMLQCARCGVHLPKSQAITLGEKTYCSREHLRADQQVSRSERPVDRARR